MERTLAIIKPDAVAARHVGRIVQRIEAEGFQICAMRMLHLSQREAEGFYAVHRERPFFGSLTQFMSEGPVVVGLVIAAIGLLVMMGLPLGRLPGDMTYRRGNTTFYFPLATSILLSIVLTVLFALMRR